MEEFDRFLKIWSDERSSEALLPYRGDIVDLISALIKEKESSLDSSSEPLDSVGLLVQGAVQMEILRWQYLLESYISCRFRKIQRQAGQLTIPPIELMSPAEKEFCKKLMLAFKAAEEPSKPGFAVLEEPDCNVFFSVINDIGDVDLSGNQSGERIAMLKTGSVHFTALSSIQRYLDQGDVALI